ncbi:uncharacterized protein LOC114518135 [Dendronephthya gigantea]|uniref:uncharacterized protein LOC114518135 n=1 Tax=Dendronephthya gigantea TaxID=151771 RepID=UPI00106BC4EB|nr:uncharacterized protein LOC114518135 [Dendronephthya gigantea]XP_028393872.1 uncharacterized protein LOC114518135 [Dendronephthya gigantea]
MTRQVKAKRDEIRHKKYRGLLAQFIIFLILRSIDIAASVAVLRNAWTHSADWANVNYTLLDPEKNTNLNLPTVKTCSVHQQSSNLTTAVAGRNKNRRSILENPNVPSSLPSHIGGKSLHDQIRNPPSRNSNQQNLHPRRKNPLLKSVDHRNTNPTIFEPRKDVIRKKVSWEIDPVKRMPRGNEHRAIKRRSVDFKDNIDTISECEEVGAWSSDAVSKKISEYKSIFGLTAFFNAVSFVAFLTHLAFWIASLRFAFQEGLDSTTRITRLTRNSLLSLMTAIFRDVPLSCLNLELLVLRSGSKGLACVACIFAGKCRQEDYVEDSLNLGRTLLYFYYTVMLINSFWKGVSGFYRLSRFKDFNLYYIRASASIVFGLIYCVVTFTPAMFVLIYRYFPIAGQGLSFLHDLTSRLVVVGATVWVIFASVAICCPILYLMRLNVD